MDAAWIGLVGAVIGGLLTPAGRLIESSIINRSAERAQKTRKHLLLQMLSSEEHSWRSLTTLSSVIGSSEDATKDLLLQIGARASEDGKPLWALIERHPLKEIRNPIDREQ
jgi:hypothetical protein